MNCIWVVEFRTPGEVWRVMGTGWRSRTEARRIARQQRGYEDVSPPPRFEFRVRKYIPTATSREVKNFQQALARQITKEPINA
jgi:hypothetical protein